MKLPRHGELWIPGYFAQQIRSALHQGKPPRRAWFAITDHYEPFWRNQDPEVARERVALWLEKWPKIASSVTDSAGGPAKYSFFYPEEEYRPELLDGLREMVRSGNSDVEIHIHHDREPRNQFVDRMSSFIETLSRQHNLLHREDGHIRFGFIHGNWALDNSLPGGKHCGLNDEISILRNLGCYADFTMPSGDSPSQARTINQIYWVKDDPEKPKSYDTGVRAQPGKGVRGDLLMIPGPLGFRWRERLIPRMETGELASYDPPTSYRVKRWYDLSPRLGEDIFIKVFTHGTQERNSQLLLNGGLQTTLSEVLAEGKRRSMEVYFVTAWEMFCAVRAIYSGMQQVGE